jgi:predicted Zn-dependent protease
MAAKPGLGEAAKVAFAAQHAKALVRAGDYAKARAVCEHYLSTLTSPAAKSLLLDCLVSLVVIDGITAYAQEAYQWCERALEAAPDRIALRGTKGSLLVELGRVEEGVSILEEVYKGSRSEMDQGIAALYLAIAAQNSGDTKGARRWTRRARWLHPEPWLYQRLIERNLL